MNDTQPFWKQLEMQGVEHSVKREEEEVSPGKNEDRPRLVTMRVPVSTHVKLKVLQAVEYERSRRERFLHEILDEILDKEIIARGIRYK